MSDVFFIACHYICSVSQADRHPNRSPNRHTNRLIAHVLFGISGGGDAGIPVFLLSFKDVSNCLFFATPESDHNAAFVALLFIYSFNFFKEFSLYHLY